MIELLAPAGNLAKLKVALDYGADACYIGGEIFGLRAASASFTPEDMEEGLRYAHARGKKVYLTLNIIPHNDDIAELQDYLESIRHLAIDAFIVSDPGTIMLLKETLGEVEIHLSTQANTTNAASARFWMNHGVRRIVLARELSLREIAETVTAVPEGEFEVFIHGAMCMSYSGRCLISNFLTGRDANRGDCAQSCRWNYHLVEAKRPGEYFPVEETPSGTAFFSSKDLCALPILDQVVASGVTSLKIEGRNKSAYYVASVVRVYREALDRLARGETALDDLYEELLKVSHRDYTTGFFVGSPDDSPLGNGRLYIREYAFIGVVLQYDESRGLALIEQRNHFRVGDEIEVFGPLFRQVTCRLQAMSDEAGNEQSVAPHPKQKLWLPLPPVKPGDYLRKKADEPAR